MTLVEEAQLMAGKKTLKEIEVLTEGRQRTDIEHLAYMFAMQREIEERIALKKAKADEKEAKHDSEREKAESLYLNAKEKLRLEKKRHCIAEDGFAEEKASHRAERDRHAKAIVQFKKDAEPWRKIVRAEKEEERAIQAETDKGIDDFLAEQNKQNRGEENKR